MALFWLLLLLVPQAPAGADEAPAKLPELQKELQSRFKKDQDARLALVNFMAKNKLGGSVAFANLEPNLRDEFEKLQKQVQAVDQEDLAWMKGIIAKHGWLGKSLVGKQGANAAWLLVQHADTDREFQDLCLKKMKEMPLGEVQGQHIAYLTDRLLIGRGKKQLYGTQGKWENGKIIASPIEDEAHVDDRRKAIGLAPLAEYLKQLEKVYTQPELDKQPAKKPGT
jgi:hypothetical protein